MVRLSEVFVIFCLAVIVSVSGLTAPISCKNDDGDDVTWFFKYKLPKGAEIRDLKDASDGTNYLYVDSNSDKFPQQWNVSLTKITSSESALAKTLLPLTTRQLDPTFIYVLYNDEVERKPKQAYGHTKGILMYDHQNVVWVIHSIPSFPVTTSSYRYQYPTNAIDNGQTVFCVTFPSTELEKIVTDLWFQRPYIYPPKSDKEKAIHLYLNSLVKRPIIPSFGSVRISVLKDLDNNLYTNIAKPDNYVEDVYSGVVARLLHSHLLVSTWRNGKGGRVPLHLNNSRIVANIEKLTFKLGLRGSVAVDNTADHSKWAISVSRYRRYVCIGTLNRMFSQYKRGGETLCFVNQPLYLLLCTSLASFNECYRDVFATLSS